MIRKLNFTTLFSFYLTLFFAAAEATSQIINVEDKRVRLGDSIAFKGFADVGFSMVQNDRLLLTSKMSVQAEKVHIKHFFLALGGYNLVKAAQQNFLNDGFFHLRYNFDVRKKWVWEAFTQGQYNQRTRITFRGLLGTGVRTKIKFGQNTKYRFYLGAAYMLEHNQFKGVSEKLYEHRFSSYLSYNLTFSDKARLVHTTYYQPKMTDWGQNRISSEASLVMNITKKLVFRATGNFSFDNDLKIPEDVPNFVFSWNNGLRWEF